MSTEKITRSSYRRILLVILVFVLSIGGVIVYKASTIGFSKDPTNNELMWYMIAISLSVVGVTCTSLYGSVSVLRDFFDNQTHGLSTLLTDKTGEVVLRILDVSEAYAQIAKNIKDADVMYNTRLKHNEDGNKDYRRDLKAWRDKVKIAASAKWRKKQMEIIEIVQSDTDLIKESEELKSKAESHGNCSYHFLPVDIPQDKSHTMINFTILVFDKGDKAKERMELWFGWGRSFDNNTLSCFYTTNKSIVQDFKDRFDTAYPPPRNE